MLMCMTEERVKKGCSLTLFEFIHMQPWDQIDEA